MWTNISIYVLSYLYMFDKSVRADAIFSIDLGISLSMAFGNLFGTYLLNVRRVNPKFVVLLGASISICSMFAASYVTRLDYFVILFGFLNSFGTGMSYFVPMVCGWEYFP